MMRVISWGQAKNNDVIDITFGKTKFRQHLIHVKFYKGVFQTK
jgi:hypothetical protein